MCSNDNGLNLGPKCRRFVCVRKAEEYDGCFRQGCAKATITSPIATSWKKNEIEKNQSRKILGECRCLYVYVEAYSIYVYALAMKVRISSPLHMQKTALSCMYRIEYICM